MVSSAPSEMRHSADLCEGENGFRDKRKEVVFEAMKNLLGNNGPKKLKQVWIKLECVSKAKIADFRMTVVWHVSSFSGLISFTSRALSALQS